MRKRGGERTAFVTDLCNKAQQSKKACEQLTEVVA